MTLGKRISDEITEQRIKLANLCERDPELDYYAVDALIRRGSQRSKHASRIARALGVHAHWLQDGKLPKYDPSSPYCPSEHRGITRNRGPDETAAVLESLESLIDGISPTLQAAARDEIRKFVGGERNLLQTQAALDAFREASKAIPPAPASFMETNRLVADTEKKNDETENRHARSKH